MLPQTHVERNVTILVSIQYIRQCVSATVESINHQIKQTIIINQLYFYLYIFQFKRNEHNHAAISDSLKRLIRFKTKIENTSYASQ